jgi:hypothetical protein
LTATEIREFVEEYHLLPHGQKRLWLTAQGISYHRLRRWRAAVFDGDLDRGLIPRESGGMTVPPGKRAAVSKAHTTERKDAELARLQARVHELEQSNDALGKTNEALGKAIGLLHRMREQEPDAAPTTSDPCGSSTPRTNSSPS